MGIYDRDYERNGGYGQQPGLRLDGPRTLTTNLVLFTFGIYLVQLLTQPSEAKFPGVNGPGGSGWFTELFALHGNLLQQPWRIFELLTYGFLHAPNDLKHILWNMVGLWFFGRTVESHYGRREYLLFYLVAIVFAGAVWLVAEYLSHQGQLPVSMLGASGGLTAVLILFALNFPNVELLVFGILPVRAWMIAVFCIGTDVLGAIQRTSNVAFTAHLGGALFAYLYFKQGWKLGNMTPTGWSLPSPKRRPKLRVHDPGENKPEAESETDKIVDEILKKIQAQGQDSLTRRERRILEKASKEYQRKRK
ncbi:MAG: rhomboid family intramembrane serine protease [Planctomycetes bacterium]|nr:rhomboid family intramembrane serine protease [Planctomycetota bacterium]